MYIETVVKKYSNIFDPCCYKDMYSVPLYSDVCSKKCFSITCDHIPLVGGSTGSEEWWDLDGFEWI